jgi:hypothetical protein
MVIDQIKHPSTAIIARLSQGVGADGEGYTALVVRDLVRQNDFKINQRAECS